MIKEIISVTLFMMCCSALPMPAQPLQKVVAVIVPPETVKSGNSAEIFATAETGWRNRGGLGGGIGQGTGWRNRGGGFMGGYLNYGGGWKKGGFYRVG
ncbi:glycine-rich cell wall structural protein 1-like [Tribolium madens]|uniref:glycine-rich cell wall structural protein 1-like n=1 Tax=Tribolium madens TaxID=41895 RepID=UPI001CF723A9|nr:glycine-rich cell wall structural protein 1-like [Tribolium madens]